MYHFQLSGCDPAVSNPLSPTGGVVGLRGNLAPEGAIVKVAGMTNLSLYRNSEML